MGSRAKRSDDRQRRDEAHGRIAGDRKTYRWEAVSVAAFVQQLTASYLANGYFFYVRGEIPPRKDPAAVDRKLLDRYGVAVSKYVRCRQREAGQDTVHYLRYRRTFLLLAHRHDGTHHFFADEATQIHDVRRRPIQCFGYSIGVYAGKVSVRISRRKYQQLTARLLQLALRRDEIVLAKIFATLPFEPYRPVRRQLWRLFRQVNEKRKTAGLPRLASTAVRTRRKVSGPRLIDPT